MRGITFILAPAMVLAGFAVAKATEKAAEPAAPPPIKLAVFSFELEDFSAAAAYTPPDDIDREQLRLSTEEARRLIAQSGHYQLVDVSAASDEVAKAGKLHDCDGCEAKIAAGLNADRSMIGIVTRISRTDYAVTYKIRDAQSGALVDVEQTDLRAGANSAWSRGARWLIQRRLLEKANERGTKPPVRLLDVIATERRGRIATGIISHAKADETEAGRPRLDRCRRFHRQCCSPR